jgi:HlyD family secretion protein
MKRHWKKLAMFLAMFALLGVVVRGVAAGPPTVPTAKDAAKAERDVAPPAGGDDRRALPSGALVGGNGIVEPRQRETRLAGAASGVVSVIHVKEGDKVAEGDVLLELESLVEKAAIVAAQADLAQAQANLDRTARGLRPEDRAATASDAAAAKARADLSAATLTRTEALAKGGASTPDELDRARLNAAADAASATAAEAREKATLSGRPEDVSAGGAGVRAAKARLEQAQATLDRRVIRAPYAGEILQVKARVGEYYSPGASEPLLVLGDTSKLRVRMDVDERDVAKIALGKTAFVTADAFGDKKYCGKVAEIGRRMGRKNIRTDEPTERLDTKILEVVVDLDDAEGLVPGLRVTSYIDATPR